MTPIGIAAIWGKESTPLPQHGDCCRIWLGVGAHRDAPLPNATN